ncbi:Uncharacterized damage-inducible protein DinB (forms a four-helix bundle) [Cnuella takakiae]|uniref:Uncharacterized damage-inducible protein DinB (Forms a four-helix bundle) n=1 Tax=Cnuella takakiae TaxID=1302690 RepID=A0A1M5C3S7_9BACT|nr:DinB family protein [Cnuella takakiae]OLY93606.1 hypothetical protein BUE76_18295 [Cnuella takakiae]SHF49092.1 Uncharacterized damage-inducible protein DinB (forms a four-helix bundle) [Cnuella takakiae]
MKEMLTQLSAYHLWANQQLLHAILLLPSDQQQAEVGGSFPSLHLTLLHMWDAESIWWQRMRLQERVAFPSQNFDGTTADIITQLLALNKQWHEWVAAQHEHGLEHVFLYQNSKKEKFKQPIYQMLLHLFNHGTYHRGQLVSQMRQLGLNKIPQTDFIVWSRKKIY